MALNEPEEGFIATADRWRCTPAISIPQTVNSVSNGCETSKNSVIIHDSAGLAWQNPININGCCYTSHSFRSSGNYSLGYVGNRHQQQSIKTSSCNRRQMALAGDDLSLRYETSITAKSTEVQDLFVSPPGQRYILHKQINAKHHSNRKHHKNKDEEQSGFPKSLKERTTDSFHRRLQLQSLLKSSSSFLHSISSRPFYNLFTILTLVHISSCRTIPYSAPQEKQGLLGSSYLMEFGYLPKSGLETGELYHGEVLQNAIRRLQQYAGLVPTGVMDEATEKLMKTPRCGLPDVTETSRSRRALLVDDINVDSGRQRRHRSRRYVLGPSRWEKRDLTYRILNYTPDVSLQATRESLKRAFNVWTEATYLTFTERFDGDADIQIKFASGYHGDAYPFDSKGLILAHAFFPGEDRGGDIHFDEDEPWTYGSANGTNLFMVAAHELGHSLGLSHSSVMGSLMYPWYQGYDPHLKLNYDDEVAIQYLYGYKPPPPTLRPPDQTTTTTSTTISTTRHVFIEHDRPTEEPLPDMCDTTIDAIAAIRGEIFAFKDEWTWRFNKSGLLVDGFPVKITRFWKGFPQGVSSIDAVYERYVDGTIVFFKDDRYWVFEGLGLLRGFPSSGRSIQEFGFPQDIRRIDAAFVWGYNLRTYFITGDMYWRYDEHHKEMLRDYPRDMSIWKGVPVPVTAAFTSLDRKTYFFHKKEVWEFNDHRMKVSRHGPRRIGNKLFNCEVNVTHTDGSYKPGQDYPYSSATHQPLPSLSVFILTLLFTCATLSVEFEYVCFMLFVHS